MFRRKLFLSLYLTVASLLVLAQSLPAQAPPALQTKSSGATRRIAIRAGHLIDGKSNKVFDNVLILIDGDNIVSVTPGGSAPAGAETIDLSKSTVLPGFIDLHTHVL